LASDELVTARLRLRRWQPEDEQSLSEINSDPEVTKYLNRPVDAAATKVFFALVRDHWEQHGFGFWALEPLDRGGLIGFAGVSHPTFIPELAGRPELGWRLARVAWGKGLAFEAATAAREHAFAELALPQLISIINPDNVRSRRLARRLGMDPAEFVRNPVTRREVEVWRVDRPAG
jgi:RimJ/RimL family protein N-acetyltransferase